jgi:hypothetical protein
MKRRVTYECFLILQTLLLIFIGGCSSSKYNPGERAQAVSSEDASADIFNVLDDYPALEACFTTGTMTRKAFEDKLFRDLLSDPEIADTVVSILDGLPPLFEPRTVPEEVFEEDVEEEMNRKGPLPDLFSALADLPGFMLALPEDQKNAFYAYLDLEDTDETASSGYLRKILYDAFAYISTCDPATVNMVMDLVINDIYERQSPQDQTIDLTDIDTEINRIVFQAPDGLANLIQGARDFTEQEDVQTNLIDLISSLGRWLGDDTVYPKTKAMLTAINATHTKQSLGEILERVWTRGAIPGSVLEEGGVQGYGKSGKYESGVRELLATPRVLNAFIEELYTMDHLGYRLDRLDDQFREYATRDAWLQALDGPGDYGDGRFYEPAENFSFKNFSAAEAFIRDIARWNTPLTLTWNVLYEGISGGDQVKNTIRSLIPNADNIPLSAMIWAEVYEKGAGYTYGHGQPVTTQRGYGTMVDGVYVAPLGPDAISAASMALTQIGDAIINGPYDNIYDNMRWCLYHRKTYLVVDLVQFISQIPSLEPYFMPYFTTNNITSLPIVLSQNKGINPVIYADTNIILGGLITQLAVSNLPSYLQTYVRTTLENLFNTAAIPSSGRAFLLPQDIRDLWTIILSLCYYDPAAFHMDRFLDESNAATHAMYYDVSEYTYANNSDKINPIMPLLAGLSVAAYREYHSVVDSIPFSFDNLATRKAAAQAAFGGVEQPVQFVFNILSPMIEQSLDTPIYSGSDAQLPFLDAIIPVIFDGESSGMTDAIMEGICILGQPGLRENRLRLLNGLAAVVATTQKDSSSGAYALAGEMLSTPQKALADERYWEAMRWKMETGAVLLSSEYDVVENLKNLLSSTADNDLSEEDNARLARALTTLLGRCSEERIFSRCLIDITDIVKHLNSIHTWRDLSVLMQNSLKENGVAAYIMDGLEKAAHYSWESILEDVDTFLHSDLIMQYDLGSFWHAIKSLINFLVDAIE